jgi:4a-hydroxytetrahydrobiopterin dehydratase
MLDLLKIKCKQPVEGEKPLTDKEIENLLGMVTGWTVIENEGEKGIGKRYTFDDFAGPLEFAARVGKLAEEENHHPAFFFAWGRALLSWRTHKVKGLSLNDFIMAAKTDEIYSQLKK